MQKLEPLCLPLQGVRLIEASAGTGKTYTLVLLYLRLLLNLGDQAAFGRCLSVREILVVTFTEAATQELRDRIRCQIHQFRLACLRHYSDDPLLKQLLIQITDRALAIKQLELAEQQMDEAAIYTIHGFCQRILNSNAFDINQLFQQQLLQDEQLIRLEAAKDFWRIYFYSLPLSILVNIRKWYKDPTELLNKISSYLNQESISLLPQKVHCQKALFYQWIVAQHTELIKQLNMLKQQWLTISGEVEQLIIDSGIDKRTYSRKNLPNWVNQVTEWAEKESDDYMYPDALKRFGQNELHAKTTKVNVPMHPVFADIDHFLRNIPDVITNLKSDLLIIATSIIYQLLQQKKQQKAQYGFDDLLQQISWALSIQGHGERVAKQLSESYPVAMLDEFQDTDNVQYTIFQEIYAKRLNCTLLLIGDPKQAIYGFRGADVFTYMQVKRTVDAMYTMDVNWRSSSEVIKGINTLFNQVENPFIFEQIPYVTVSTPEHHQTYQFLVNDHLQPAIRFCLLENESLTVGEYQQIMADYCAEQIQQWLMVAQQQKALLRRGEQEKAVTAADIAILVRNGSEAKLISQALIKRQITAVYLSNHRSVFETVEAKELVWLLQAVLSPENEQALRTAIGCRLLDYRWHEIEQLNHDENLWEQLIEKFINYQHCWYEKGIMPMLYLVMNDYQIAKKLLLQSGGERRLTDVMHLCELLQDASYQLDNEYALVRWLITQIEQPSLAVDAQQQRLESDRHLVKIVTFHKAKGLEYPIVFLPFVTHFKSATQQKLYHDRKTLKAILDFSETETQQALIEEERLAEDLRLLYVGITRAIYHCSIGLTALAKKSKKETETLLHKSAIGYLIQQGQPMSFTVFCEAASQLLPTIMIKFPVKCTPFIPVIEKTPPLEAKQFNRIIYNQWRVNSYSSLLHQNHIKQDEALFFLQIDDELLQENRASQILTPDIHHFPKGARVGTLLHTLLEEIDFTAPLPDEKLSYVLCQLNLGQEWMTVLKQWITFILTTPLQHGGLTLQQLAFAQRLAELQFYMPVRQSIVAKEFHQLACLYDPLTSRCDPLQFAQFEGMLKGFIDLVFYWKGQYFLVDYKSNWLGERTEDYQQSQLEQIMCKHRYDVQYQLYSIALHRYLKHRLPNYDFNVHFGGIFYLFLRGMDGKSPENGVFFYCPPLDFMTRLDNLFG